MHHFQYKSGELYVEDIPVSAIAAEHGTPVYVYSAQTFTDHFSRLDQALSPVDHMICYAMKANSNLAVLSLLAQQGCGFDVVSGGELFRVLKAGGDAGRCTFAGVGKTKEEIEYALKEGIYSFIVESEAEMHRINEVAGTLGKKAPIAIRVNPNVDANTHAKITTGTYENKFGIAFEEIPALYDKAAGMPHLHLKGVQMHIGSQITTTKPFRSAVEKMIPLVKELAEKHSLEFFDIGGGIGIVYQLALESGRPDWWKAQQEPPMTPADYAQELLPLLEDLKLKILVEPGRFIAGNAGILVTDVVYVKNVGQKNFVIVDAAMNDLVRPAMYESYHEIIPVVKKDGDKVSSDVVGPICESGDTFCKDRELPAVQSGDLLAMLSAGAYGFVMAGNYNSRPRPAEILVNGDEVIVARKRETLDELIQGEVTL